MQTEPRAGRPRASSREVLAEAACELFLERGYEATSVVDIAQRAGVSRSSFFNYFESKADVLWSGLDERVTAFENDLADDGDRDAALSATQALTAIGADFAPDSLALALVNAAAMGLVDELERESALRAARIARAVSTRLQRGGAERLRADVLGAAYGGAVLAALGAWARDGAGRTSLPQVLTRALDLVQATGMPQPPASTVRQLRVVVHAPRFDEAISFYRDALGLAERASYQGEGDARVIILEAGAATLELANSAQVALIDAVETDGGASDRIRVAFEVEDTHVVVDRLSAAGADVEASARVTPWRSLNARLRAPADLQITLFEELGPEP